MSFDVAVIGLGAAGAAALETLARRGVRAVGLDRFSPPHDRGASHGESRILRVAYGEGSGYTPLLQRAVGLWGELEARTGLRLFEQSGLIYAGPPGNAFLAETRASAARFGVELRDIAPAAPLTLPAGWQCLIEPGAGFLHPERAIQALLASARTQGAEVRTSIRILSLDVDATGVRLETSAGPIRACRCLVAAGAWAPELLPQLAPLLHAERRAVHWFADPTGAFRLDRGFRPFYVEDEAGRALYGFPDFDGSGPKIAEHLEGGPLNSPDVVDRNVSPEEQAHVAALAGRFFSGLGPVVRSQTCLYPMSKDTHFVIDRLPGEPAVSIVAGLSGHGFKFAPVLGELAADLVLGEGEPEPLFRLSRFDPLPPRR